MKKKSLLYLIIATVIVTTCGLYFHYKSQVPYRISNQNVMSIYYTYSDKDGEHKIEVSDSDKETILSEISRMTESSREGEVGAIRFNFTIELANGNSFTFCQSSTQSVLLRLKKDGFSKNIWAPKTGEIIKRLTAEHNMGIKK